MVYNTQNYWVFGLCPSSGILEARKHKVSETGSVFILKWGGGGDIRAIFKTKHTLSSLMKTRPESDPQQTAQYIYSIPCECVRSYIGETGRPLAKRLRGPRDNLKEGLLEKSKLAQHAYEEGHRVGWDEAVILEVESNSRYRKYKDYLMI
jgi:hypothetical protein